MGCRDCCRSASLQVRVATFEYSWMRYSANPHPSNRAVAVHVNLASWLISLADVLLNDRDIHPSHRRTVPAVANKTGCNCEASSVHIYSDALLYAGTQPCFDQSIISLLASSWSVQKTHHCLTLAPHISDILSQDNGTLCRTV